MKKSTNTAVAADEFKVGDVYQTTKEIKPRRGRVIQKGRLFRVRDVRNDGIIVCSALIEDFTEYQFFRHQLERAKMPGTPTFKGIETEKAITPEFRTRLEEENLTIIDEQTNGDVRGYEVRFYTDAGQEFIFTVNVSRSAKTVRAACEEFIKAMRRYAREFDVSEETYKWLDEFGHGKNGAPYDMKDVYADMESAKEKVYDTAGELKEWLDKQPDPVDVKTLKDIPTSKFKSWKEGIGMIHRPYIQITKDEYETIMRNFKGDVCYSPDGRQFSYGNCDLGYALMPLQEKYYFPVP